MHYVLSRGLVALGLLSVLALAGCGANYNYGTPGGNGGSTPATNTSGQPGAGIVATATATVGGTSTTILTDAATGRSLYYFANDSSTTSACTSGCASTWPPLIVSSGSPTSTSSLPGTLSALDVGNGQQVLYNGHPLYRYSGDSAAGETKGDGIQGKWHIATPNVGANSGATGQPTPTCTGYYCNGY
jgi:predicted lipoprotein with Yx(FWY)xxD motif